MAKREPEPPCPQADRHTPAPASYTGWHHWAVRMSRTHMQTRCPGCGLYEIWIPKVARAARAPGDVTDGAHSPADAPSPVSAATEAHGETTEAQEARDERATPLRG